MKITDFFALFMAFTILGFSFYLIYQNFPQESVNYVPLDPETHDPIDLPVTSSQFHPNMRYKDTRVTYSLEDTCNVKKTQDVLNAFSILSSKTLLKFENVDSNPEIVILCSEVAPDPEEKGHFVAGEGGPSEVINTTSFSVILSGKVSLFRTDKCDEPQIALHEILHALGFDHNGNESSIMYPVTGCDQKLDRYIVDEINRIYSVPSLPDLALEDLEASRVGRYLDFRVTVSNQGLEDSKNSNLVVYVSGEEIETFALNETLIGNKKVYTVENLRVPRESNSITFMVETSEDEISKSNNAIETTVS